MNLFILGKATGVYRTQNFIKYNLDYTNNHIYFNDFSNKQSKVRLIRILVRFFLKIPRSISTMYKISQSDVVYVSAMNHDNWFLKYAVFIRKPVLTDFYVSKYDTQVFDWKNVKVASRKARKIKQADIRAMIDSDIVTFLNMSEALYYGRLLNVDINSINYRIVPLCVNEREPVSMPYFNDKRKVVNLCWWGTYIPLQGLDKIIKAVKILKDIGFPCKLNIFGDSEARTLKYRSMISEYGLLDMVYINNEYSFKNGKLGEFLVQNCDIALGIFGDSEKAKTVIANKIIDGIAMKAPVITGSSSGLTEYFDGKNDIYIVNNTEEEIAEKIIEVAKMDYYDVKSKTERAFQIYKESFSVAGFNDKMHLLLSELNR